MTSQNIAIRQEAYDFLKAIKGKRSFSEAILGLKAQKSDAMQFFGVLKDKDWAARESKSKELRRSFEERLT